VDGAAGDGVLVLSTAGASDVAGTVGLSTADVVDGCSEVRGAASLVVAGGGEGSVVVAAGSWGTSVVVGAAAGAVVAGVRAGVRAAVAAVDC
jgi:hypothetical protein